MLLTYWLIKKQMINTSLGLPFGLLIPYTLGSIWMYFANQSHNSGGMFYLPTTIPESIAFVFFALSTAPAFIAFLFIGYISRMLESFGLSFTWSILFSFPTDQDSLASIVITLFILFCQSWVYGLSISSIVRITQPLIRQFHKTTTL